MEENLKKDSKIKKLFRIFGLIVVFILLITAISASFSASSGENTVWDENATKGSLSAKNHFIVYSDLMCPYCVAFENAIFENEADFEKYIEKNDILFEVRLSDFLYNYGEVKSTGSRYSAEAVTCAEKQGKFWDYYQLATTTVWQDFYKDSGKSGFDELNQKGKDYWISLGDNINLNETSDFRNCVENGETDGDLAETSAKMARNVNGLPFFKFNNYTSSGFDLSWGWDYVLMYFDAGLKS